MKPPKKILIIRFSSIGDIVLTSPVIRNLKQNFSDCEIHFLTKSAFYSILECNPYLSKIHLLEADLKEVIENLRKESFDLVLDLHRNLRTRIVKTRLMKSCKTFKKLNAKKWLLVNFKINRMPKVHIVDRYLEVIKHLGIENDGKGLDYFIAEQDEVDIHNLPESFHDGYVGLVIGGKHKTKQMPADKLAETCTLLDHPVLLLGGKEDYGEGEQIKADSSNEDIYNACGVFNLSQSASLVRQSKVIIAHDTGLMHIASAFKKKIVSIWGNTVPELGMYPYLPIGLESNSIIFEVSNLKCRPCSKIGFKSCPKKHFNCMNNQRIEAIVDKTLEYWKSENTIHS